MKYEVDDDVFYDDQRSLVWDEAENRMWSVMGVFMMQLRGTSAHPMQCKSSEVKNAWNGP